MKVILLYVSSLDGKITRWGQENIYKWTSKEDAEHFFSVIKSNNLIVMGSATYDAVHPKPEKDKLRLVITRTPKKYNKYTVPGQLEFVNDTLIGIHKKYAKLGFKQMILVSGSTLSTQFFRKHLVDEFWLTIEPRIFGSGDPMTDKVKMDICLELLSMERLNNQGTILLKYKVVK